MTGCLRPTPAELRRKGATLSLACGPKAPGHLGGNSRHLISRHPFVPAAQSVHLTTIAEVWRSGRITDGMRKVWSALRNSVLSFPTHSLK